MKIIERTQASYSLDLPTAWRLPIVHCLYIYRSSALPGGPLWVFHPCLLPKWLLVASGRRVVRKTESPLMPVSHLSVISTVNCFTISTFSAVNSIFCERLLQQHYDNIFYKKNNATSVHRHRIIN